MAKTSSIERNDKRARISKNARVARLALKKIIRKGHDEAVDEALLKLQKRPRNESVIRVRHRCRQCGRACGTLRKFALCRIHLRELACRGEVPGLRKASW